jgi:polysaccharide biosynthesis transport protein
MNPEQAGLSVKQTLSFLRRRGLWILLCIVLVTGLAYVLSKRQTRKYTATAAVVFNSNTLSQQIAGLSSSVGSSNDSVLSQQDSNLELVRLGDSAAKTAHLLGHGLTDEKVNASVTISGKGESSVVDVSATSSSPALAAAIANTYAREFVKEQQLANSQFFKSALALVHKQLAALSPAQRIGSDGLDLVDREHTLALLAELGYNNVQVAQEAPVPASPSSPKTKRNVGLGVVLGLLLGLGVALLLERLDGRVREPEELEAIYGLPMLGVVPKSAALAKSARPDSGKEMTLPQAEAEAFGLIRAHLRFFNVDREVRTVVIASPAVGDGKTTIARHLAEAAAMLGSRVLLLEADLRQPTLAQQFSIDPSPGLAGVLIGTVTTDEATRSVNLKAPLRDGATTRWALDVLAAGSVLPPNPGELIESQAMGSVLEWARSTYDLVVIDTPPLTAVSDAFPLLRKVDGVVIVGRVGLSQRKNAEQLHQVLAGSGAPLLGIVANESKRSGLTPYAGYAGGGKNTGGGKPPPSVASPNGTASSEALAPAAEA